MSFPPRHPMMRGMMMPPFGAYPPMGMMPMGMMPMHNMMPHMMRNPTIQKEPIINHTAFASPHIEKLPATTVFVGNIHEKAPDTMIKTTLQKCGNVTSWKRVQGTTGKLQAFGFCEFEHPESTLRCMRLLNELLIVDKKLLVKVDAKTNTLLEDYKRKRHASHSDKASANKQEEEDAIAISTIRATMKEYHVELNRVIFDTSTVASSTTTTTSKAARGHSTVVDETDKKVQAIKAKQQQNMHDPKYQVNSGEMDEDIQTLVTKEIRSFRDAHLNERDESKERNSSRSDRKRSRREDDRNRDRDRDRDRERDRERNREKDKEREREREVEKEGSKREREVEREGSKREREVEREGSKRERERPERTHSRSKTKDVSPREEVRSRLNEGEDDEELYERKKLERKLREKEAAYQELLRKWESRERKRFREHEKERHRERERRSEENKESKRLREFLEDYSDERDDVKYYKGSALQQRLFERQKEMDSDERDRMREREEVDEIRRKLQEEGREDVEEEIARIEREREQHLMPCIPIIPPPQQMPSPQPGTYSPAVIVLDTEKNYSPSDNHQPEDSFMRSEVEEEDVMMGSNDLHKNDAFSELDKYQDAPVEDSNTQVNHPLPESLERINNYVSEDDNEYTLNHDPPSQTSPPPQSFSGGAEEVGANRGSKRKMAVHEAFSNEDIEHTHLHKKQRFVPLNYDEEDGNGITTKNNSNVNSSVINNVSGGSLSAEEKRKWIKNFIECIPVDKESLFAWQVDWSLVDDDLIERRIKPWVNKKIIEYIGEDEPALSDFICKKVLSHTPPDTILSDISMVLDDEAEVFVMKMWRLLVYEIEAKKCGVIK